MNWGLDQYDEWGSQNNWDWWEDTFEFLLSKAPSMLPEHCLDIDDGLGICHVVFLSTHGALLVHNDQVVSIDDTTLQQVVQAVPFRKQQWLLGYDMLENGKYKNNIVNTTLTPKKAGIM